jgi:cell shape-determining protein MreD
MTIDLIRNIARFFILVFIQILILNNINLSGYINPYLYVMVILMMPFDAPKWLLLIASFLTGFTIDIFSNSAGMHAAACTFMGYSRPLVLKLMQPRDGYEFNSSPSLSEMGPNWFLTYASIMVFIHHFTYFFIEIFRFNEFLSTIFRVILSSITTLVLIVITQLLFSRKRETSKL